MVYRYSEKHGLCFLCMRSWERCVFLCCFESTVAHKTNILGHLQLNVHHLSKAGLTRVEMGILMRRFSR